MKHPLARRYVLRHKCYRYQHNRNRYAIEQLIRYFKDWFRGHLNVRHEEVRIGSLMMGMLEFVMSGRIGIKKIFVFGVFT